jgi:hypothetical protein
MPEASREELETTFTPMLRRAWDLIPDATMLAFVDQEGECIDYVSAIDAFEAKVLAAHAFTLLHQICYRAGRLSLQSPYLLEIAADERMLCVRRLTEEYVVVTSVPKEVDRATLEGALSELAREFRSEAGLPAPPWDSRGLQVTVRDAVGWAYAPEAYTDSGTQITIADVLGRWTEPTGVGDDEVVCFRVRTETGREITLVHDPASDGWRTRA